MGDTNGAKSANLAKLAASYSVNRPPTDLQSQGRGLGALLLTRPAEPEPTKVLEYRLPALKPVVTAESIVTSDILATDHRFVLDSAAARQERVRQALRQLYSGNGDIPAGR